MSLTVTPPRPLTRKRPQLRPERRVVLRDDRLTPLGRAGLPDIPARPPLRQTKPFLEHQDRPASTLRAHQFPRFTSRNA
jgi:hypothetical protein